MKWNIGDSVRFLNEPITGIVWNLRKDGWIEVETEEGMILSVPSSHLVSVHRLEKKFETGENPIKPGFEKDFPNYAPKIQKQEEEIIREFDLHIEELGIPYRNLANYEIVRIQLNYFENKLGESIQKGISPVTFIHGVGNGVLRQEIRKRLLKNPYVSHFENKGKDRKGFGATEVFLKP